MNFNKITLAALMALLFVACSDDGKTVAGGAAEETGVQASLEKFTIAGKVGNVLPRVLMVKDSSEMSPQENVSVNGGMVIAVYELDSASLNVAAARYVSETLSDSSGNFSFEELSLKSPYVMISVLNSCRSEDCYEMGVDYYQHYYYGGMEPDTSYLKVLNAIVDLRETRDVSVNILTHIKVPVLCKYVSEGLSFSEANSLAEKTILERYGVYDKLGSFEKLDDTNSDLAFVRQVIQEYEMMEEWSRTDAVHDLMVLIEQFWNASPDAFARMGGEMEQLYRNTMKMIEFKVAYWSHYSKKGQCTDAREGEMFDEILKNDGTLGLSSFVCRSGKWIPGYKKIEYVRGTLTDARDGKTYKTVTYDIGGKSQTWMAEDLDYTGAFSANGDPLKADLVERSLCTCRDEKNCELSSREYKWEAAMNINVDSVKILLVNSKGDTVVMPEICQSSFKIMRDSSAIGRSISCNADDGFDCLPNLWGAAVANGPCDSVMEANGGLDAASWNYTEQLPGYDPSAYQGICPEGWRLPNVNDWAALIGYMEERYGIDSSMVGRVLLDEVATGFGMKNEMLMFDTEEKWTFASLIREYIAVPDFALTPVTSFTDERKGVETRISGVQISDNSFRYTTAADYNYVFDPFVVRCIKN